MRHRGFSLRAELALAISCFALASCSGVPSSGNQSSSGTSQPTAAKTTPVITWAAPAAITNPTPLGAAQLDATANVPGTFVYTPPSGTVLTGGTQTLSATFTPTNTGSYNNATASVSITVNAASPIPPTPTTPTITWATPAAITNPTPLSATQLDATANVPGTFVYTPPAGTVLAAGTHTLSVSFTPSSTAQYTTANDSVSITVNPAATTSAEFIYVGGPNPTISGIAISNGSVTTVPGSPFTGPAKSIGFTIASAGDLIFGYDQSDASLVAWKVDAQTGALSQISSSSQSAVLLSVDPTFQYLYGWSNDLTSDLYGYSIDHQNGQLTALVGSPFSTAPYDFGPALVSPDGQWMCGTAPWDRQTGQRIIVCYQRDPASGGLVGNAILGGEGASNLNFAKGDYLIGNFVNSAGQAGIEVFQPTAAGINQVSFLAGVSYMNLAVNLPTSLVAATTSGNPGNAIILYSFDSKTGTLTQLSQTPMAESPVNQGFSCNGAHLAVVHNADNLVSIYAISGSSLQELSGSPITVATEDFYNVVAACP
jgi:6-phosphogluconolactonase (cycloisomerase 2 family)